ncbi:MAG TPA: DegV family protein, partial [Dehalococcoidales bacterium]|nr:DegV family protein [Dehalococcoidales bacterium]
RSMSAGLDYMYGVIAGYGKVEALAVEHSTTPDDADALVERLGALFPRERIRRSIISPVVGTYAGPKALALTFLEAAR